MTVSAPDLGVPAARNARFYACVGLGVTAVVGLLVWDLVGIVLGTPLTVMGLVRALTAWRATAAYPRDRRAVWLALAAFAVWIPLTTYIAAGAQK